MLSRPQAVWEAVSCERGAAKAWHPSLTRDSHPSVTRDSTLQTQESPFLDQTFASPEWLHAGQGGVETTDDILSLADFARTRQGRPLGRSGVAPVVFPEAAGAVFAPVAPHAPGVTVPASGVAGHGLDLPVDPGNAARATDGLLDAVGSTDLFRLSAPEIAGHAFEVSWQSGEVDEAGTFMSATEVMNLVGHKGQLYAGTSLWMNLRLGDPPTGAQVLRLDSPEGRWQVDKHFDEFLPNGAPRIGRISALQSVTFQTDVAGQPLPSPETILVAGVHDAGGQMLVYARDDATGTWTEMVLGSSKFPGAQVRSFGFHRDTVTGVDLVFAGTMPGGVFSGAYDPSAPGRIRWSEQPELKYAQRFMAFSVTNGRLYAAAMPRLFQRSDGPAPTWEQVLEYPEPPRLGEGLRALTTIPGNTLDRQVMLATFESAGAYVVRVLPDLGHTLVIELDIREFLLARWGGLRIDVLIAGYNDLLQVYDPHTQQYVHIIGMCAFPPEPHTLRSSWYLIRYPDATYDLREIPALPHPFLPNPVLLGNRTMVVSPFPQDEGRYLYFGGYDSLFIPTRHSGWIYRTPLDRAL